MSRNRITWQEAEGEYGIDLEDIYYRRLAGEPWKLLSTRFTEIMTKRLTVDWCIDHGHDPEMLQRENLVNGLIVDARMVDRGRVVALARAGWKIRDIAEDCRCTEECVRELLNVA